MEREYGYIGPEEQGSQPIFLRKGQNIVGYSVGIIYLDHVWYPLMPRNVVNAYTYDFPVRMKAVRNLTNDRLFNNDPTIVEDIIAAAKSMVEEDGVRAICSACSFFGNYQQQVRQALDVPVTMSSLVQLPCIQGLIKPGQKIGILTANKGSMTPCAAGELWCEPDGQSSDQGCPGRLCRFCRILPVKWKSVFSGNWIPCPGWWTGPFYPFPEPRHWQQRDAWNHESALAHVPDAPVSCETDALASSPSAELKAVCSPLPGYGQSIFLPRILMIANIGRRIS